MEAVPIAWVLAANWRGFSGGSGGTLCTLIILSVVYYMSVILAQTPREFPLELSV
jgi:hypothetical protein